MGGPAPPASVSGQLKPVATPSLAGASVNTVHNHGLAGQTPANVHPTVGQSSAKQSSSFTREATSNRPDSHVTSTERSGLLEVSLEEKQAA
ncbi:unnamed protein product [Protopolystoma xenopodis]|uniref:Uncharacterized protein n=1 Tax=Protopolystoma xenopodis TaxID=117903 RepID=A0A3S5FC40_9PLAT|nr:unnamed protein product [Protopolystoma xenopodis]